MNKTKTTGKMWTGITSTAMCGALALMMLNSQRAQAALCSANFANGIFGPAESVAHVGDTIHYDIDINFALNMCLLKQGTNFLVTPDGLAHRVGDNYAHSVCSTSKDIISPEDPVSLTSDPSFVNPSGVPTGTFDVGFGSATCFTYLVNSNDVGRTLSFTTPQGNILSSANTGPTGSPDGAKSVWFSVIMDGIVVDCTNPNVTNKPTAQGPAHVLIVTPGVSITKECDNAFTPYGQPINFHGIVCNTGDDPLQSIGVTNTPAGGSPAQIVNFDSNVTTNGTTGRAYDGSLLPGECIGYHGSETPVNACGPQTNTVTVGATDFESDTSFIPQTVYASNSAVCFVSTAPCINVTKTCPQSIAFGAATYPVSGVVSNCGNVPLVNVQVVDDNGTPGNPNDDTTVIIGSLDIGASQPWQATETVPNSCGPFTNTATATGNGLCGGGVTNSASCTTTVIHSPCISVTKTCPTVAVDPNVTATYPVSGVVSNCGTVTLTNVSVVDDNGTPGNPNDDVVVLSLPTLAVGASAPWNGTESVTLASCPFVTNTVTATGQDICSGASATPSHASCITPILCPKPKICVVKGIVCKPQVGDCDSSLNYGSTATGMAGTNQSAFCYQVIAWNCGGEVLTNVNLVDNLLGALSGFPTVLNPGQFATNYYSQSYGLKNGGASTNVNTVTATGTGINSGIITNAQSSAKAIVLPIKVSCNITLFSSYDLDNNTNDNKVTLPDNGSNSPVEIKLNICNNGKVDLNVNISGLPALVDCESDLPLEQSITSVFVPAGQCYLVDVCTLVACPGTNINVTVQGTANVGDSGLCLYDANGNAINTASSSCSAVIVCQQPVSCRVTGGGTLQPGNVDQDCIAVPTLLFDDLDSGTIDHISHGGQLGAPFSHQDCGEILGNPCIRGEWEHNRHYSDGKSDAISTKFHSSNPKGVYDTLMCACLGCCGPTVDQPNGKFLGIGKKFTLCNPDDHRVCGPMPRPAPANAIIFTGIGAFGHAHGKGKGPIQATTYAVFRVYIEDRSEPGGSHPGGAIEPADVYCFQAWDTTVPVGKKTDYSTVAVAFRKALAADSCAFIQSISTPSQIVNGHVVGGVPPGTLPSTTVAGVPADVADQGPIWGGNQQIHPSTGATCSN